MKYKSNQDIELCCDYQVSKQMTKTMREIYSQVILDFVSKKGYARYLYSTCMGETKQSVKERITVVFEHHKKRSSVGLIIIGIITITSVGGFVSFSHASISAVEDKVDQEVSETEELIMYTDDIENYYNYLITESSTKIYAVDSQRIYMIDKETKEIELFYTSEAYNIMANKLIGKWLYFTEYNSFTDGNICRINVETAEKETVLENAVAYEIFYKDREIYLKLPTEIIGYEMDSEGYLQKEIDSEEIYKLSDQAYISDAVYIEECTDGKELYYTYKDELYKNVVMYDGKEEQVLFYANNVELITPEGIYYKKDSVIGFYDFVSKQVDDHFCEDFHYLSYMNEMSTPTPTYDEEYLYYAIEKEPGITSFIRISRENGLIEEFYQIDMVESVYGISVSENILFVLCSEEDTSLNILDMETNEWIMN